MSVKKFKFVSPGVFINEIDNSQLPAIPAPVGPVVIGRSLRGPAMRPVTVGSFEEFVNVFGPPIAGTENVDRFRHPAYSGPAYGTYAAQAWLKNSDSLTYVRLLGKSDPSFTADSGEAGWAAAASTAGAGGGGGAYGLFLVNSASNGNHTAALGAVLYMNATSVYAAVSGNLIPGTAATASTCAMVATDSGDIKVVVQNNAGTTYVNSTVNFSRNSDKYIRKVLNTNPTKVNSEITPGGSLDYYFLGETYDRFLVDAGVDGSNAVWAFTAPLGSGSIDGGKRQESFTNSQTGWIFSQDLSTDYANYDPNIRTRTALLFKFHGRQTGDYDQSAVKVSIENIRPTKTTEGYGRFSVVIRKMDDNDARVIVVERFDNCTLNPASPDYVAAKIGDRYLSWNNDDRRYVEYGTYDNHSSYVRIEMDLDVSDAVLSPHLLPYGVYGQPKFSNFVVASGSNVPTTAFIKPMNGAANHTSTPDNEIFMGDGPAAGTAHELNIQFPQVPLRTTTNVGAVSNLRAACFGMQTTRASGSQTFDESIQDVLRAPFGLPTVSAFSPAAYQEYSDFITLDDVELDGGSLDYTSGSRAAGTSLTAVSGAYSVLTGATAPKGFTFPLFGGFDGLDITEKEPFANKNTTGESEKSSYAYHSLTVAMDSVKSAEVVESNIMTMPGITTAALTKKLLDVCEARADSLCIMDLAGGYSAVGEGNSAFNNRVGSVTESITTLEGRAINSSYGCAFYPWVRIKDSFTDSNVWIPPSVAGLGVMSNTDKKAEPWFAPAGFTRGGLTQGAAGLAVTQVIEKLISRQRDDLYEANINPIASFPTEGIVVLGQKTLQVTPSALDRINVRRLMIFIKREISFIARTLLFEPNLSATWQRFLNRAEPLLTDVKGRYGLTDFKIILDETTTTPELIDRNIMYAKIYLKPARAIEFIALDFVITNTGASFED